MGTFISISIGIQLFFRGLLFCENLLMIIQAFPFLRKILECLWKSSWLRGISHPLPLCSSPYICVCIYIWYLSVQASLSYLNYSHSFLIYCLLSMKNYLPFVSLSRYLFNRMKTLHFKWITCIWNTLQLKNSFSKLTSSWCILFSGM